MNQRLSVSVQVNPSVCVVCVHMCGCVIWIVKLHCGREKMSLKRYHDLSFQILAFYQHEDACLADINGRSLNLALKIYGLVSAVLRTYWQSLDDLCHVFSHEDCCDSQGVYFPCSVKIFLS